jgi:hypothetical protein
MLAAEGLAGGDRLLTLYGGMDTQERERIKAAFQAEPSVSPVRILLATDAASEGIDLQNHCARLIHYEIPWNPNRMEQPTGASTAMARRLPKSVSTILLARATTPARQGTARRRATWRPTWSF